MANVTNTSVGPFIPEIWANEALQILRSNINLTKIVTKDTDLATFQVGNTLNIPYPGTFQANAKVAGSPVTLQTPNTTNTTVTLDHHEEASILVEDFTRAQTLPFLMQSLIHSQMVALAEKVESDLLSLYSSFSTTIGTAGTALSAATLRSIAETFTNNKVPEGNRHLILAPKDMSALLADTSVAQWFAFNSGQRGDITNGVIRDDIYGLQLHQSQLVPTVAGTPVTTNGIALDPGAIILASRALPQAPENSGVAQSVISDPESGLVLRVTMGYDKGYLGVQVTIDVLYGFAKLFDAKGIAVVS